MNIDTRMNLYVLVDYNDFFGKHKNYDEAKELINKISSRNLLEYISFFSVNLFLNENNENTGKTQFNLVNRLLGNCGKDKQLKWTSTIKEIAQKGHSPIMFWNYSNLLFQNLILENYNELEYKQLSNIDLFNIFKAYLIINSLANGRIKIKKDQITKADEQDKIEELLIPSLIYQRDYISTLEYTSQLTRGVYFFKYLDSEKKHQLHIKEYYNSYNLNTYKELLVSLLVMFTEINIGIPDKERNYILNLKDSINANFISLKFIEKFCINSEVSNYKYDDSFGFLRRKFLYQISKYEYLILDVNFLINQFYSAQVFSFNSFLKKKKYKGNFLSEKGKDFTEEKYLPIIINSCFPNYINFFGTSCINSSNDELCDVYVRSSNKICLIEFKDVMLNSIAKNEGNKEKVFNEFNKKFISNQKGKPKGISQLINAINDINNNDGVSFDKIIGSETQEIYPIILYTDLSFGTEGINKVFNEKFQEKLKDIKLNNIKIKKIIFINLTFFENNEDYFNKGLINIFDLIDSYIKHIEEPQFMMSTIEVYTRIYMNEKKIIELGTPSSFNKVQGELIGYLKNK
ncbi:hypothetical protein [Tenacibaculum insulae]|uniref:hypothetical protein n=1 Tax=Tenacibaculum insulae TaxID=2029677 RepID=UPI003AB1718C